MDDELLMVRVAELYYEEGKTQDEIGALLSISRWKVGRVLIQARECGIVRIDIVHPRARRIGVERQLCEKFALQQAVVVPIATGLENAQSLVTQAAADFLAALRPVPRKLGVSWGRTLAEIADRLPEPWAYGVNVVQINGGVTLNRRPGTAATLATQIARKGNGQVVLLPSPAVLERRETKDAIAADRTVAGVLELALQADLYLYSAGPVDEHSALVDSGYLQPDDIAELARKGAVGDVLGRYIDADGNIVDPGLNERTLGIEHSVIRNAEYAVFVVSGEEKLDIARSVVSNGLCSIVITDEGIARSLLEDV